MAAAISPTLARTGAARDVSHKYLIFTLGAEEFGIQVLHIKEIMQMQHITPVPQLPPYVKGVINLRGQVIPVVDLALRLHMTPREFTPRTCIVVVRHFAGEGERLVGAIADGVSEVLTICAEEVEESPDFGAGGAVSYVRGMAKIRGKVKLLLDTEQVFSSAVIPRPREV
jgi:purine-binding chemotaxis protein CheW